jgi:GTP-binding protein Era
VSYRSGLVGLAGRPNVGKSTLANALAGRHVAAVSQRPQTTRRSIKAVVHGDGWQAVLLDLPGFQRPADGLTRRMQATVDRALEDCDAALFVVNAAEPVGPGDRFVGERLRTVGRPVLTVVNQVDRVDRARVAEAMAAAAALTPFEALHPVSALTGDGLGPLVEDMAALLPEGPRYFPEGLATDQTDEELAGEIVREAALRRVREEVPHALAVEVEEIEPRGRDELLVHATIVVEHESQKGIVIGVGGTRLRDIGREARLALGRLWGRTVHLDLRVAVRPRWRRDERMLDRLGL